MKKTFLIFSATLLGLIFLLIPLSITAQLPAFPDAEGYGRASLGGRGGQIIEVTNLDDSGPGSFREACMASGARIVVFRVAGIIEIDSDIAIRNPYITIAGQTAPGDGICIKFKASGNAIRAINIETHDVVIRYLRIRCGYSQAAMDYGSPYSIAYGNAYNIILDHCSSSWHPGRTGVTIWPSSGRIAKSISIQRHLAAEALVGGNYPNGARGAFLFGSELSASRDGEIDRVTMYKNLMAHHNKRHPEAKTCQGDDSHYISTYQLINNVSYHFEYDGMMLCGNENDFNSYHFSDEEVCHYNVIGNYFKRAGINPNFHTELALTPGARLFVGDTTFGNIGPNRTLSSQDPWDIVSFTNHGPSEQIPQAPSSPYQSLVPFDSTNLPPFLTAEEAYIDVTNDVGANKALNADGTFRDASDTVDLRIIQEVISRTGRYLTKPEDVGGWPEYSPGDGSYADSDIDGMADTWENIHGFDPNNDADGILDADADGYTNVEEFLNGTNPRIATGVTNKKIPAVKSFSVFPNPSNGIFTIAFDALEGVHYKLEIRNLMGKTVYQKIIPGFKGSISKQFNMGPGNGPGMYFVSISEGHEIMVSKIVIE